MMNRILRAALLTLFFIGGVSRLNAQQVYNESGGLVIMEMENTESSLNNWDEKTNLSGYTGSGFLQFDANAYTHGPADSPLEFYFKINEAGLYYLHMRCAKQTIDGRSDVANDAYVRVEGDYSAGPAPWDSHGDNASLSLLQQDTKYFGGRADAWKWENGKDSSGSAGNLDPGGESNKRVALYDFKAGETYKLVVSGRSRYFRIDRLMFRKSTVTESYAENLSRPESDTISGGETYTYDATTDFPNITAGEVPYYKHTAENALAIDASNVSYRDKFARAQLAFNGTAGNYDVTITSLRELDGESTYRFLVNGVVMGTAQNNTTTTDYNPEDHTFRNISIPAGATLAVESNTDTNGNIPEGDGTAWARGRWTTLTLSAPEASLVNAPAGRIAYVADGNSPDPDDIGANAVMFGLLDGANMQDRLVHFSHSCDLVLPEEGSSRMIDPADDLRRQNYMHQEAAEGIAYFGPFNNLGAVYNCKADQAGAINDLKNAINASSAGDPLWIIEAGEPDIIGYALEAANASARQYVHVVSHHPANDDSGDFFTWQQILDFGVTEHQIGDQNVGLKVLISTGLWDWADGNSNPAMNWIVDQLKYAEADGVVPFQDNYYDCSDAGMVYWWLTGANSGGDKFSTPVEIKEMLLYEPGEGEVIDPKKPVAHWKLDEGAGASAEDASGYGRTGTLMNGATWGSDAERGTFATFDGSNDRIFTPFIYALSASDDFTWAWWANSQLDAADTTQKGAVMVGNRYPERSGTRYGFIKMTPQEAQFANVGDAADIDHYDYTDLPVNEWHHYAMVKEGNSYQWYVDGVAQGSPLTLAYSENSAIPFLIGGDDNGDDKVNEHFNGYIDDVVLYQRALTASDLAGVMNEEYWPIITMVELGTPAAWSATNTWSDSLAAHSGADYVVPATGNLLSITGTSSFPGDALTVMAGGKLQVRADEASSEVTIVNDLILSGGSSFDAGQFAELAAGTGDHLTNVLNGTITHSGYSKFLTYHATSGGDLLRSLKVLSAIEGDGTIRAEEGSVGFGGEHVIIANAANTFSGTWEAATSSTLTFASAEAVGAADINVLDSGKLAIQGYWSAHAALSVADTATTEVDLDYYTWFVDSLVFGSLSVPDGTYTAAELNALGANAVFTGSGSIAVGEVVGGPVAHWRLDEAAGTVAQDSSGNGQAGTLLNGAGWGSDATRDSYVSFDGSNDRITTPFTYALASTDDFTWAWWANSALAATDSTQGGSIMVGNRYPESGANEKYEFIKFTPAEVQFANTDTAGTIEHFNYTDVPQGGWHHYAMVKTGTSCQWYVDGVAQGSPMTINYNEPTAIPLLIGGDDDGSGTKGNEHFQGFIDDVVLYDRALAASEVLNVRNGVYGADPTIPVVDAGNNATVNLPENQADLTGSATDDGTIVSYLWTQVSGPNTASLTGESTTTLSVGDLVAGTYVFKLTATDDEGKAGSDTVSVVVVPESTAFATVTSFTLFNADTDVAIPGFDPIPDGATINKAAVGTSSFNIGVNTSPSTDFGSVVMALSGATTKDTTESIPVWALFGDTAGDYKVGALNDGAHTITATPYDQDAGAGEAGTPLTISFTVIDQAGAPTADAGSDRVVNLPDTEVTLDGSGSDNGSITAYAWTQVSGPNTATLANEATEDLTASGLVEGTYVFRLTVTDNESNQASDDVNVSVVTPGGGSVVLSGELKQWHKVTLMMEGPSSSETATPNPFTDYRMNVTFTHPDSGLSYVVPGYFAADGNAANTGATSGNKWVAHISPDHVGTWNYTVSFRTGTDVAMDSGITAGTAVTPYNNTTGSFVVSATDKTGRDHRGKGRLEYVDKHHLQFAGTGEYFLKAGADAPENLLAYNDVDDTPNDPNHLPNLRKTWSPHASDYDATDAAAYTWDGGKGSELLGAIKYLSDKGANAFSFLTFGLDGDDDNVFPHLLIGSVADYESVADNARWASTTKGVHHDRFDVSKMGQWEKIFEYGDKKGMYLHFKTQETENDQRMDGGALGRERKVYYRELVARYGHHLAMNWNLGEENTNSDAERKAFAQWFNDNDPYGHNVVLHSYPAAKDGVYTPMLGSASKLTGLSLQTKETDFSLVFPDTLDWVQQSAAAGKPWVVACDEPGDANQALRPANDPGTSWTDGRKNALWGNVMAGGAGVEFYFGYQYDDSDMTCQDFRSRDGFWDYCRYMLEFFNNNNVPFWDMANQDSLVSNANAWCLRKPGESYVVYLKAGGTTTLNLGGVSGTFEVRWFDPRNGGALQNGSVTSVLGGSTVSLGTAPSSTTSDWVVLVQVPATNTAPTISSIDNQTIIANESTDALAFTISDTHTVATALTLSKISSDTVLVPEGNIVFGGSGSSRTVTVTPAADEDGDATISVVVGDGEFSTTNSFQLTVLPVGTVIASVTNNTVGTSSWICPAGVTSIQVECWGGGGAGGAADAVGTANVGGGGGAGGAYARKASVPVTPGTSYALTIPAAATAPAGSADGARFDGAAVTFVGDNSETVTASGGQGGVCKVGTGNISGAGGAASIAGCVGDVVFAGGNGAQYGDRSGGGGGGGAGDASSGGNAVNIMPGLGGIEGGGDGGGGRGGHNNGQPGQNPGGGGGGAKSQSGQGGAALYGGIGGLGQIIISYVQLPAIEPPMLGHEMSGGDMVFNWAGGGFKVQSRTNLTEGAWEDVPGSDTPPVTNSTTQPEAFYRLIEQ